MDKNSQNCAKVTNHSLREIAKRVSPFFVIPGSEPSVSSWFLNGSRVGTMKLHGLRDIVSPLRDLSGRMRHVYMADLPDPDRDRERAA